MAETQAYRLKADTSIPKPIRQIDELYDGSPIFETVGVNYRAGDYVYASEMTPTYRESVENGEMDNILEPASADEAKSARSQSDARVFIPEHEAEREVLNAYGHETIGRDQVLELRSAGADAAAANLEAAKEQEGYVRGGTAGEYPPLTEVSNDTEGGTNNVPVEGTEPVEDERLRGVEQPPGFPVGADLAAAEGATEEAPKRQRPQSRAKQQDKKDENSQAKRAQE